MFKRLLLGLMVVFVIAAVIAGILLVVSNSGASGAPPNALAFFEQAEDCRLKSLNAGTDSQMRDVQRQCAIDAYRQAITVYDQDWRFYYGLAQTLSAYNRHDAVEAYTLALRLKPDEEAIVEGLRRLTALTDIPVVDVTDRYTIFADDLDNTRMLLLPEDHPPEVFVTTDSNSVQSGTNALVLRWAFGPYNWMSLIFGVDQQISDKNRAEDATLIGMNLTPPEDYVLHFFLKGNYGGEVLNVKFQDQNVAIRESLGNQVGQQVEATPRWSEYCLPLSDFEIEKWIIDEYGTNPNTVFDWMHVKQINFDPLIYGTEFGTVRDGVVFLDQIEIMKDLTCGRAEG